MSEIIEKDFIDLIETKGACTFTKYFYLYKDSIDHYGELVKTDEYFLFKDEANIIKENSEKLRSLIEDNANVFEIGPGTALAIQLKTLASLSAFNNVSSYTAIDISIDYSLVAVSAVEQHFPNLISCALSLDFLSEKSNQFLASLKSLNNKVILNFGSMLMNTDSGYREKFLKYLSTFMNTGDLALIGLAINFDPEIEFRAYNHEHNQELIKNILRYFKQKLELSSLNVNGFKVVTEWELNDSANIGILKEAALATQNQNIFIKNKNYEIKAGEKFYLSASRRFKKSYLEEMCAKNHLKIKDELGDMNNRFKIFVIEKI
jgi:uncharacterized SAM-dependent methyltransferase